MRLVVLGDPVAHSRSPAIQTAALRAAGIPGEYRARRVDDDGMRRAVEEIREGRLNGANVTMPHKRLAADLCDMLEPQAARAGVVNTLVAVAGTVIGHNTDIAGVRWAWSQKGLATDVPVVLLGTGGAAAAGLLALEGRPLVVQGRSDSKAQKLVRDLGVEADVAPFGTPVPGAVVVNATPLGMTGEVLPSGIMEEAAGLFDMAYGAVETPTVRETRRRGIPVVDGLTMLIGQAAESFRLWTGRQADVGAMVSAVGEMRSSGRARS